MRTQSAVQDLASKVGGGEQQRSSSPETSLQLECYEMEDGHLTAKPTAVPRT
jgi:hypothetical protein